jgi:hypothetical protein
VTVKDFPSMTEATAPEPNQQVVALLTELLKLAKKGELYTVMVIAEMNGPDWRTDFANITAVDIPRYLSYVELAKYDMLIAHRVAMGRKV